MSFIAYKITNSKSPKVYIGVTRRSLKERWSDHLECAPTKKYKLYHAMRKHGVEAFSIAAIASARMASDLLELEKILIRQEDSFNKGYNATVGGDGPIGWVVTPEISERMRRGQLGKKQSPETIAKRAAKLRGRKSRPRSLEERRAQSERMRGRKGKRPSDDGLARISVANRGSGNGMFGRGHTAEAKAKIAATNRTNGEAYLETMQPHIDRAKSLGHVRQFQIITYFNEIGLPTRLGKAWNAQSICYLFKRLSLNVGPLP